MKRRSQQEPIIQAFSDIQAVFSPNRSKKAVNVHTHEEYFYHQSFKAPINWLRAISNGAHRIHLDWSQIGWKHPDHLDRVSRETINQLIACFAGRLRAFALPLRPAGVNAALQ